MVDHQAAIVQIGIAEIALLVVIVAIVSALVSSLLMQTRMNPAVKMEATLSQALGSIQQLAGSLSQIGTMATSIQAQMGVAITANATTSTNLENLARFCGASDMIQGDLESAETLAKHLKSAVAEIYANKKKKAGAN